MAFFSVQKFGQAKQTLLWLAAVPAGRTGGGSAGKYLRGLRLGLLEAAAPTVAGHEWEARQRFVFAPDRRLASALPTATNAVRRDNDRPRLGGWRIGMKEPAMLTTHWHDWSPFDA
jgi:hypothetical protein